MRLLYVADPFLPVPPLHYGGIERIVADLVRLAVEAGHDVALLAHSASRIPGASLFPLANPSSPWSLIQNGWRVRSVAQSFGPDLVHSFARLAILAGILPSSMPKIMSFQRDPTTNRIRWAQGLARASLTFTGCSEGIAQKGCRGDGRWDVIYNGVDLNRFTFSREVDADAPLVFFSRIERIKGAHRAIALARAAGRPLVLAGNHAATGPEAAYWKKEIAPWIGRDGISHAGPLNDQEKNALLGRARALLVPVEWEEPFGIVFAEALACGTPVLSTPRGALPEIIESGVEGFLGESDDELVSAIEKVHRLDRSACRRKAERCFDIRRIFAQYERLYRRRLANDNVFPCEGGIDREDEIAAHEAPVG